MRTGIEARKARRGSLVFPASAVSGVRVKAVSRGESEAHGVRTGRSFLLWMLRLSVWRGKRTNRGVRKSALRPQLVSKSGVFLPCAGDDKKQERDRSPALGKWVTGLHGLW